MSIQTPLFQSANIKFTSIDHENDPDIESRWTHEPSFARMAFIEPMRPMSPFQIKKKYLSIEKRFDEDKDFFHFQVRQKDSELLLGFGLIDGISWTNRNARISLGIGMPEHRRQGYGTQTLGLLVNFSFYELNLRRLTAVIPSFNLGAVSFFTHFGFQQEACRREALQKEGQFWDALIFGYEKVKLK